MQSISFYKRLFPYQEDNVKDRETLENVGKGRLEVQLTPGEYRHTEDVAWNTNTAQKIRNYENNQNCKNFRIVRIIRVIRIIRLVGQVA